MGSGEGWSVFDRIKSFPSTPEALMAEIDAAITTLEYARASTTAAPISSSSRSSSTATKLSDVDGPPQYNAKLADEAYKAGCAALAVGKLDDALQSLQISLSKCPPHKTSAIAKLQSLISLTSQQLHKHPS